MAQAFRHIVGDKPRARHPREGGEFVDHALDIVHLPHDRVDTLVENIAVGDDKAAIFALQPFGRKLDRRQRIFDLMRNAPRHIGPRRGALGGDEIGDVIERDDIVFLGRPPSSVVTQG